VSEVTGFARWAQLMDREARDEPLTDEERAFCERFARNHEACELELSAYAALGELDAPPDDESRALVDRALRQLEAEDVERAVADVRGFRRARLPWWAIAGAASAAAVVLSMLVRGPAQPAPSVEAPRALTRAELVYASGDVRVESERAAAGRTLLTEGATVATGVGTACVLVDSDINLCLAADSSVRLAALHARDRRVELLRGTVATRLSAQPPGLSLTIVAGDVSSMAVGTAFAVERGVSGARATTVTTVMNGTVRVARGDAQQLVNAHERAISDADQLRLKPVSRSEEAASWALLGPTMLWHDPVSATLEVLAGAESDTAAEAWLDGQLIGRAPLWSLVPVGTHRLLVRSASEVLFDQQLQWNAGQTHRVRFEAQPETAEEPAPTPSQAKKRRWKKAKSSEAHPQIESAKLTSEPEPEAPQTALPTAAELLKSARRMMREGRMRAAADAYETLRREHPRSDEAHTVLVSLGQIQLTALHQPERALELLDAYLERGGTLAEEARLNRIRALRALERPDQEALAIREFLAKHPRNFEATALRSRVAELESKRSTGRVATR
jgi:hypothetical protein